MPIEPSTLAPRLTWSGTVCRACAQAGQGARRPSAVARYSAGELFGEDAIGPSSTSVSSHAISSHNPLSRSASSKWEPSLRTATVSAFSWCKLLQLDVHEVRHLMKAHQELNARLLGLMARRTGVIEPKQQPSWLSYVASERCPRAG